MHHMFHQSLGSSMFIPKSLHHETRASTPPHNNVHLIHNHKLSSSVEPLKNSPNQHSFAASYLVKSFGFTPERALWASKFVRFEITDKPDAVLAFFKNQGFTHTQITNIVARRPRLLLCNPDKSILPKLEFFMSKGLSSGDVTKMVSSSPDLLLRSLENQIIPSFNYFRHLLQSEEKTVSAMRRYSWLLLVEQTNATAKMELLREAGVPDSNISYLLKMPRGLSMGTKSFRMVLDEVKKLGFDSSKTKFMIAIYVLTGMTKLTWEKKVEVYKKWGWTDDDIIGAFKIFPQCMAKSEQKINRVMDFLVNQMGWESSFLARKPNIIAMSLQKKIVPRSAIYQALLSKGLIGRKDVSLATLLYYAEIPFLEKVLRYDEEAATELLKLYKEKMDLAR